MLTYLPDAPLPSNKFGFSYSELRDDYLRYRLMSDEEFVDNALDILHFACYVCYIKESGSQHTLSDTGIIHQLVHLLSPDTRPDALNELEAIRDRFNHDCCLA